MIIIDNIFFFFSQNVTMYRHHYHIGIYYYFLLGDRLPENYAGKCASLVVTKYVVSTGIQT